MSERKFECTKCGNCCSYRCKYKNGNLCRVHPSIVGTEEAEEKRGVWCSDPPESVIT